MATGSTEIGISQIVYYVFFLQLNYICYHSFLRVNPPKSLTLEATFK